MLDNEHRGNLPVSLVYCKNTELQWGIEPTTFKVVVRHSNRVAEKLA